MLACRNSLPPSKGHVSASNWLKRSHTQNSSFKWEGVWETCSQLSSSRTRAGPERRGEWIRVTVHCMHHCVHACVRACMCAVYVCIRLHLCLSVTCVRVCTCLCACVHMRWATHSWRSNRPSRPEGGGISKEAITSISSVRTWTRASEGHSSKVGEQALTVQWFSLTSLYY